MSRPRVEALVAGLLTLYVALLPIYVGRGGSVQVADFALLGLGFAVGRRAVSGPSLPGLHLMVRLLALLALWALLVDGVASVLLADVSPLVGALSLTHALLAVCILLAAADEIGWQRFLRALAHGAIAAACLTMTVWALGDGQAQWRPTGWFHSPNQLGYFAVCMASLVSLGYWQRQVGGGAALLGLSTSLGLAWVSASRAAMAAAAVLAMLHLFRTPRLAPVLVALALLAVPMLPFAAQRADPGYLSAARFEKDIDEFSAHRGYQRFWLHPEVLWVGASAGGYGRFAAPGDHGSELHSSWLQIPFAYGLPGTLLALLAVAAAFGGATRIALTTLAPAMVYGLAHMGLRSRAFWLVFTAAAVVAAVHRGRRQQPSATGVTGSRGSVGTTS